MGRRPECRRSCRHVLQAMLDDLVAPKMATIARLCDKSIDLTSTKALPALRSSLKGFRNNGVLSDWKEFQKRVLP